MIRVGWHPSLSAVAAQPFTADGRSFTDGDAFPWQTLGISAHDAFSLWRCGMINCLPSTGLARMTPGEAVHIETPKQKRTRAARATR